MPPVFDYPAARFLAAVKARAVFGYEPRSCAAVEQAALQLRPRLYRRIAQFSAAGLITPAQAASLRSCRAAFGPTAYGRAWHCHLTPLCPWCWARHVMDIWWAVDWAFFVRVVPDAPKQFGRNYGITHRRSLMPEWAAPKEKVVTPRIQLYARSNATLVERWARFDVATQLEEPVFGTTDGLEAVLRARMTHTTAHNPSQETARHRDLSSLMGAGFSGVLEHINVRPVLHKKEVKRWHIFAAQVLLAPCGLDDSLERHPRLAPGCIRNGRVASQITRRPRRSAIVRAVGDVMAYPMFLLDAPFAVAAAYLGARPPKSRTSVTRGCFRNSDARKDCALTASAD